MDVAFSTRATPAKNELLVRPSEIRDQRKRGSRRVRIGRRPALLLVRQTHWRLVFTVRIFFLPHHRSHRHVDNLVRRAATVHLLALTVPAVFGPDDRLVKKSDEIVCVRVRPQNDVAAFASITAVRSTLWNKFFSAETDATSSAVTGLSLHPDAIDEHCSNLIRYDAGACPLSPAAPVNVHFRGKSWE
jgi:hypothetical protein